MEGPTTYFKRCFAGMAGCAKSSTAHGVNHVANSGHPIVRTFWQLAFAAGSGIFLYHLYILVSRYYEEPVANVINYRAVEFQFPDVTLCTLLPFSIRVLEEKRLLPQLANMTELNSPASQDLMMAGQLPLDNFILNCTFNGILCDLEKDFQVIEDPRYKHCYTYSPPDRSVMSTVPHQALSIVAFAETRHPMHIRKLNQSVRFSIPNSWQVAGIRVVVHPPGTHPHPEIRGIDAAPKTSTMIGVGISRVQQIKKCDSRLTVTVCDAHEPWRTSTFNFTKEDCYTEQVQEALRSECGCLSDEYEMPIQFCRNNQTGTSGREELVAPICRFRDDHQKCYERVRYHINKNFKALIASKCRPNCTETHWHSAVYATTWPTEFAEDQVSRTFETVHNKLVARNRTSYFKEYFRERHGENTQTLLLNMAQVTVYPSALAGNEETQEYAYPFMSLLGEVGGILGLWLGCSVLTFFEPVELLLHTITPCCMRHVDAFQQRASAFRTRMDKRPPSSNSPLDTAQQLADHSTRGSFIAVTVDLEGDRPDYVNDTKNHLFDNDRKTA